MVRTVWVVLIVVLLLGEVIGQKQREDNQGRWGGEEGGKKKPPRKKDKGEGRWKVKEESVQQQEDQRGREGNDRQQEQKGEDVGFQPSDGINKNQADQRDKNRKENENKRKGNLDKPLINLIFLLVGALIVMVFILLLKLYRRRQTNPPFCPAPTAPIQFIDPQAQINDQIKAHTLFIQELQTIKSKYLMNLSSNSQLDLSREGGAGEEQATPTFKHYTFREM